MVDTALKDQLVSDLNNPYLSTLKNSYTWYVTKTTLDLIHHIYSHYACISATYISANDEKICPPPTM